MRITFGIICFLVTLRIVGQSDFSNHIHVDQFGYLTHQVKVAVISDPQLGYNSNESHQPSAELQVRAINTDEAIFTGSIVEWNDGATHGQSGDRGWWFDFSSVTTTGSYYIYDPVLAERSAAFDIGDQVYRPIQNAAFKAFYYNRCNLAKEGPYADENYRDANSFVNDLQDKACQYVNDRENTALQKDLSGGWFDAGDYNKYVTFAHDVIHNLLWTHEESGDQFTDNENIPESGNGRSDLLDEIKWELDWLLKMNNEDGSTHIKMGSIEHDENAQAPPSINRDRRYYGPTCTSASIAVASMFAHAGHVFSTEEGMEAYAELLRSRAEQSWAYALPRINGDALETSCDDGTIKAGDADWDIERQMEGALTAAVLLYQLTADKSYEDYVIAHIEDAEPIRNGFWGPYKMPLNEALLLYTNLPNNRSDVVARIWNSFEEAASNNWDQFYGFNEVDLYRAHMPDWSYHWGSNSAKAAYGNLNFLLIKYGFNPDSHASYVLKGAEMTHYFHGVNPLNVVYLSNMYQYGAEHSINEIYHTWFNDQTDWDHALTSPKGPAPGYVVGGPNQNFSVTSISPPAGNPAQKSYLDYNTGWPDNSWEISEPAIYYQAAYLRLLAWQRSADNNTTPNGLFSADSQPLVLYPNPSRRLIQWSPNLQVTSIEIRDVEGRLIYADDLSGVQTSVNISSLSDGVFYVLAKDRSGKWYSDKLVKH